MDVIITLTNIGVDQGSLFDLFSDVDGYTTAFVTNVPKASLEAGYAVTTPVGATIIRVKTADGLCTNELDLTVPTGGTGTCYDVQIPNTDLNNGSEDLYISYTPPSTGVKTWFSNVAMDTYYIDANTSGFIVCSESLPTFKYGAAGSEQPLPSANIVIGNSCSENSNCDYMSTL